MPNQYFTEVMHLKDKCNGNCLCDYRRRNKLVRKYSWAIPNDEALDKIALHSPIVEIGAGTGYWASLLKGRGADIKAYDSHPPNGLPGSNPYRHGKMWFSVKRGSFSVLAKHKNRALFLCWPPYNDPIAYDCLEAYEANGGKTFIYIGESSYGCNGDENFHEMLKCKWSLIKMVDLPQWEGIHDNLFIYKRNLDRSD